MAGTTAQFECTHAAHSMTIFSKKKKNNFPWSSYGHWRGSMGCPGTPGHQQMDPPSSRTTFFNKISTSRRVFAGRKTRACLFHSAVFERVNVPACPTQDLPQEGMFETCRTPVDVRASRRRGDHVTGTRARPTLKGHCELVRRVPQAQRDTWFLRTGSYQGSVWHCRVACHSPFFFLSFQHVRLSCLAMGPLVAVACSCVEPLRPCCFLFSTFLSFLIIRVIGPDHRFCKCGSS